MELENEARTKMGNESRVAVDGDQNRSLIGDAAGRQRSSAVSSSSGSGGYRYAAIEQAMDASASGKTRTISDCIHLLAVRTVCSLLASCVVCGYALS
eukprot:COSAG02_NODE_1197_length_13932_cov_42.811176_8_plen_97_part_00